MELGCYLESLEEAQQHLLKTLQVSSGFLVLFPKMMFSGAEPHLVRLLNRFGGWVGTDDGEFEVRFTADTLHQFPEYWEKWTKEEPDPVHI